MDQGWKYTHFADEKTGDGEMVKCKVRQLVTVCGSEFLSARSLTTDVPCLALPDGR